MGHICITVYSSLYIQCRGSELMSRLIHNTVEIMKRRPESKHILEKKLWVTSLKFHLLILISSMGGEAMSILVDFIISYTKLRSSISCWKAKITVD